MASISGCCQVVVARGDSGLRCWANWLREDLGFRPYAWLRPDVVPSPPFLIIKDKVAKTSQILVERHLIGAEFHTARSGLPVFTVDQFFSLLTPFFLRSQFWSCAGSRGRIFLKWLRLKSQRLVVWTSGPGMR